MCFEGGPGVRPCCKEIHRELTVQDQKWTVPEEKIMPLAYAALFFAILSAITNINSYDGYLRAWVGWMCLFLWGSFQIMLIVGIRPERVHWPMWLFSGSFALLAGWPIIFGENYDLPRRTPYVDYTNPELVIWSRIIGILAWALVGVTFYRGYLSWKNDKRQAGKPKTR